MDRPASSATLPSCATASSLRWFSGSDMSKRFASRCRAGEVGELSAVQLPAADASLDAAALDRIDEIVKPGVNLNPADTSYGDHVLQPALRRR